MAPRLVITRRVLDLGTDPALGAQARLEEIASQVRACILCPLHLTRTQGVPGTGPATARLMAVGEAPGENEDREGRPFVGAAGRGAPPLPGGGGVSRGGTS